MYMALDLTSRAEFLRHLAPEAGDLASAGFAARIAGTFTLKGPQDFLTETDVAVENFIRAEICAAFPQDAILGEEGGGDPAPHLWVIDPVDGTANFVRGVPHFCVCISFCENGVPLLGAIFHPVTGEFWFAQSGRGAQKNGAPLSVTATTDPNVACLEMGWSRRHSISGYLAAQGHILTAGANIRRGGSGALALAWVAEGRSDGYIEASMDCWDCLAGMLIVKEAGGSVLPFGPVAGEGLGSLGTLTGSHPVRACTPALAALLDAGLSLVADPDR
ncbi:MAG: inositol monophosphatase [Rhodobacterales bacterium]|nr:inositol monophosphatase [Rhodobacterales bacterium]